MKNNHAMAQLLHSLDYLSPNKNSASGPKQNAPRFPFLPEYSSNNLLPSSQ